LEYRVFCIHHTDNRQRKRRLRRIFRDVGLDQVEWVETYHPRDRARWGYGGLAAGSIGETSCALKHRDAIRRQVEREIATAVILEDDVDLPPTFRADLNRWLREFEELRGDILMIGTAFDMHVEGVDRGRQVYLAPTPHGRATHAYAIPLHAARVFARELEQMPKGIGHDLNEIVQRRGMRMCWVEPGVEQLTMTGDMLSSVETRRTWEDKKRFLRRRLGRLARRRGRAPQARGTVR
jgi:hypothetical protein